MLEREYTPTNRSTPYRTGSGRWLSTGFAATDKANNIPTISPVTRCSLGGRGGVNIQRQQLVARLLT